MSNINQSATRAPFYELVAPNLYLGRLIAGILVDAYDAVVRYRHRAAERRRVAQTVAALRRLDAHTLRDIGLHRSQIVSVAEEAVRREARGS